MYSMGCHGDWPLPFTYISKPLRAGTVGYQRVVLARCHNQRLTFADLRLPLNMGCLLHNSTVCPNYIL